MFYIPRVDYNSRTGITANAASNLVTLNNHGLKVDDAVMFSALTGGAPLAINTVYYVWGVSDANNFYLKASLTGGAIDITANLTAATMLNIVMLTLPQNMWLPGEQGIGGSNVSGAGVPNGYELRRAFTCNIQPRFFESEHERVLQWLRWAQRNPFSPFQYRFNQLDAATAFSCYLESPKQGEKIEPQRDPQYPRVLMYSLMIRSSLTTDAPFLTPVRV